MTHRGVPARILFWLAFAMLVGWLVARWWGLTDDQTITRGQRRVLIGAGVIFLLSWVPLPRFPSYVRFTRLEWPTRLETLILVLLAALITTVDILWSSRAGLLAYPPFYDGIKYVFDSKHALYLLSSLFEEPEILRNSGFPNLLFSPVWTILLMLHYLAFGVGEWQAYTVRFWPTFLLLYIILWLVRKESNSHIAWIAVVFTALLPTLSVSVRATLVQFYSRSFAVGWYLADLRPDLLFAVLLLWATAPLIQYAGKLDSHLWLVSGIAAALALLTKPSAVTLVVLAWGLAFLVVLFVNRATARETIKSSLWGFGPFFLLVLPWIALGGLGRIIRYIHQSAVSHRELWSDPDATLWTEMTYYWHWFANHMGPIEGWLFLVCGLIAFVLNANRKILSRDVASTAYLFIAFLIYGIVSVSPSKNFFLGLSFFLLLWIFSWVNLAHLLEVAAEKSRIVSSLEPVVAALYLVLTLAAFWHAVKHWPAERVEAAAQVRVTTQEIVHDLGQTLRRSDQFLAAPLFGIPATFQLDMIQRDGSFPRQCRFNPLASLEQVVKELGSRCKAILLYRNDEDQRRLSPAPRVALTRWEAVAEWVKNPRSGYRFVKAYHFPNQNPWSNLNDTNNSFTMDLYVLDTSAGASSF